MTEEEGGDEIGFVAVGGGIVAVARKIAQERLGTSGSRSELQTQPQHGGSDGHVEELNPEMHLAEGGAHVGGVADGLGREFGGNGKFAAELIAEQPLIEGLHGGEQRDFPDGSSTKVNSFEAAVGQSRN